MNAEPREPERSGAEQPGPEQPRSDQSGPDQTGAEPPAAEPPGAEQPGSEQPGAERLGAEQPGSEQPGAERLGSAGDEAAQLLGALVGWVNDHIATGDKECQICPICILIRNVRDVNPEAVRHLAAAGWSLAAAARAFLDGTVEAGRPAGTRTRIDIFEGGTSGEPSAGSSSEVGD